MKKPSLQDIVFRNTLPNPKGNEPTTFFGHVQRNLVPEVRHEVQVFYGSLDCSEARYPGLDYTYAPHRRRLARYTWHRRLFRTFDELRLTDHEILSLCQWEGTRSAKEIYEAETKKKIRDTTADDIPPAPVSEGPHGRLFNLFEPQVRTTRTELDTPNSEGIDTEMEAEQSDEDDLASSIGVQLNQQLQAAVDARSRGEPATVDAQWEQWMKEALERNEFDREVILQAIREGRPLSQISITGSDGHGFGRSRNTPGAVMASTMSRTTDQPETTAQQPNISQIYDELRSTLSSLQSANNQLSSLRPMNNQLEPDNVSLAMLLSRNHTETAR